MTSFVSTIGILLSLNFVPFPCQGQINLPPSGNMLIVAPGDDATIKWTFNNTISQLFFRAWDFTSRSRGSSSENIAVIIRNNDREIKKNISLPRVEIQKPATLVLRSVDHSYDGTYQFRLQGGGPTDASDVRLFVAKAPTVTVCASSITVDEGQNLTCLCNGENGNPPATVTWYKDGVPHGDAKVENQTLSLSNVDRTDSGTYKCVAQSSTFKDEESIEVILNFAPKVTSLASFRPKAVLGKSVTITCEASGHPSPSYTIKHNGNKVSDSKAYKMDVVGYSDAGLYQCIAKNKLGNDSKTLILIVTSTAPTTTAVSPINTSKKVTVIPINANACICNEVECGGVVWWRVVVSVLAGFIIGILLSQVFGYFCRRFRNRKPVQSNPEPPSSKGDSIYQDLDLSKMNEGETYQSLQGQIKSGNDESAYTELNLVTAVEDNYQNLGEMSSGNGGSDCTKELKLVRDEEDNYESLTST